MIVKFEHVNIVKFGGGVSSKNGKQWQNISIFDHDNYRLIPIMVSSHYEGMEINHQNIKPDLYFDVYCNCFARNKDKNYGYDMQVVEIKDCDE